jgi:Fusaric acid resistance protein-like/Transcriptional regulatory protein, C terminal
MSGLLGWFRLPSGRPDWARGVKLAVAMMAPLIAGIMLGRALDGLFVAVGAFVVASTDIGGGYRAQAIVLGLATLGVGGAYLAGAVTGARLWLAAPLLALVLFASALAAVLGARAAVAASSMRTSVTAIHGRPTSEPDRLGPAVDAFAASVRAARDQASGDPAQLRAFAVTGRTLVELSRLAGHVTRLRRLADITDPPACALHRPGPAPGTWRTLTAQFRALSPTVHHAIRVAAAGPAALLTARLLDPAHGAWLVSSAVLVMKPNLGGTIHTSLQRAAATVAGALLAAAVVAATANRAVLQTWTTAPSAGQRHNAAPDLGWCPISGQRYDQCVRVLDLGPLAVLADGEVREIPGRLPQMLLRVLAREPGRSVPVAALVDALWGEDPPRRPDAVIEQHVWRLRKVIEPDRCAGDPPQVLVRAPGGYALHLSAEDVDSARHAALVESGGKHLAAGRPLAALESFAAAEALWRGSPAGLPGPGGEGWLARLGRRHPAARRGQRLISGGPEHSERAGHRGERGGGERRIPLYWFRHGDGKIIEHWANRDDLATARQAGWVPPSPRYLVRMALAKRRARAALSRTSPRIL